MAPHRETGENSSIEHESLEQPMVTAYIIRHGETGKNKLDPNRNLTDRGVEQTRQTAQRLAGRLDPARDRIRLYHSGMARAEETMNYLEEEFTRLGFEVIRPTTGIVKRIRNLTLTDEYRKKLKDTKFQEDLGHKDNIVMTWLADPNRPAEVETPQEATARIQTGIDATARIAHALAERQQDKREVAIGVTHGGPLESYLLEKMEQDPESFGGDLANCEGFEVDFYGDPTIEPKVKLFGAEIEQRFTEH